MWSLERVCRPRLIFFLCHPTFMVLLSILKAFLTTTTTTKRQEMKT